MNEQEAIERLKDHFAVHDDGRPTPLLDKAASMAINALEAQIKLKEYIERINQPEYQDLTWSKQELVLLLYELVAK